MKRKWVGVGLSAMIALSCSIVSMAGEWRQSPKDGVATWWYDNQDGTYAKNGWTQIDGSWYYFDESGWMLSNTTTPDGYFVAVNGAWTSEVAQTSEQQFPIPPSKYLTDQIVHNPWTSDGEEYTIDTLNGTKISITGSDGTVTDCGGYYAVSGVHFGHEVWPAGYDNPIDEPFTEEMTLYIRKDAVITVSGHFSSNLQKYYDNQRFTAEQVYVLNNGSFSLPWMPHSAMNFCDVFYDEDGYVVKARMIEYG